MTQNIIPKDYGTIKDCKVILLSNENFDILHGYKAEVTKKFSVLPDKLNYRKAFITITITGLNNKGADRLYNELIALPSKDIIEILTEKGFTFTPDNQKETEKAEK